MFSQPLRIIYAIYWKICLLVPAYPWWVTVSLNRDWAVSYVVKHTLINNLQQTPTKTAYCRDKLWYVTEKKLGKLYYRQPLETIRNSFILLHFREFSIANLLTGIFWKVGRNQRSIHRKNMWNSIQTWAHYRGFFPYSLSSLLFLQYSRQWCLDVWRTCPMPRSSQPPSCTLDMISGLV